MPLVFRIHNMSTAHWIHVVSGWFRPFTALLGTSLFVLSDLHVSVERRTIGQEQDTSRAAVKTVTSKVTTGFR